MEPDPEVKFRRFLFLQERGLQDLRTFLGGEVAKKLDGRVESLTLLDRVFARILAKPNWESDAIYEGVDIREWLAERLSYYLGAVLTRLYGAQWYLSQDKESPAFGTPVMRIGDVEISPREVVDAYLLGGVEGGLEGLVRDLDGATSHEREVAAHERREVPQALEGGWRSDPTDDRGLRAFGQVEMWFRTDGTLTYTVHKTEKDEVSRLIYRVEGDVLVTDQPSAPREERTRFRIGEDGKLRLGESGAEAIYLPIAQGN